MKGKSLFQNHLPSPFLIMFMMTISALIICSVIPKPENIAKPAQTNCSYSKECIKHK
jgi:hypothetical protein